MLLALAGGLIGLLLSILAVYLFKGAVPDEMARFTPGFERLGINRIALLFNLLITMLTGVRPSRTSVTHLTDQVWPYQL